MNDGANVKLLQFINIIGSMPNKSVVVIEIIDCSNHMDAGGENMPHTLQTNYSLNY